MAHKTSITFPRFVRFVCLLACLSVSLSGVLHSILYTKRNRFYFYDLNVNKNWWASEINSNGTFSNQSGATQKEQSYDVQSFISESAADNDNHFPINVTHAVETEESFLRRMETRMKLRKNIVQQTCQKLGLNPTNESIEAWSDGLPKPRPWYFVSEKYRLIYCEIPKSGCSNWKKVLMILNGLANHTKDIKQGQAHAAKIGGLKMFPPQDILETYKNSTKILVVRDPMERLISAYLDKVDLKPTSKSPVFAKFSSEIYKKYSNEWKDPTVYLPNGKKLIQACEKRAAALSCRSGEVIKILSAIYGRYDNVTCEKDTKWNGKSCSSLHAFRITSQVCNGLQKCEVIASQGQFGIVNGCTVIPKYLTVTYKCLALDSLNVALVCHQSAANIECSSGMEISVVSAFYGRKDKETCSHHAVTWNTACSVDTATAVLGLKCNGKGKCLVKPAMSWFVVKDPCPATSKYLKVWFTCTDNSRKSDPFAVETDVLANDELESNTMKTELYIPPSYINRQYDFHASFDLFVSYLLDSDNNNDKSSDAIDHGSSTMQYTSIRHWQSFHSLSYPCHVQYDIIAHVETIQEDASETSAECMFMNPFCLLCCGNIYKNFNYPSGIIYTYKRKYTLKLIGAPKELHYPEGYSESGSSSTTSESVKKLLLSLNKDKLKKLLEMYKKDYELFGYNIPEYLTQHIS